VLRNIHYAGVKAGDLIVSIYPQMNNEQLSIYPQRQYVILTLVRLQLGKLIIIGILGLSR